MDVTIVDSNTEKRIRLTDEFLDFVARLQADKKKCSVQLFAITEAFWKPEAPIPKIVGCGTYYVGDPDTRDYVDDRCAVMTLIVKRKMYPAFGKSRLIEVKNSFNETYHEYFTRRYGDWSGDEDYMTRTFLLIDLERNLPTIKGWFNN